MSLGLMFSNPKGIAILKCSWYSTNVSYLLSSWFLCQPDTSKDWQRTKWKNFIN